MRFLRESTQTADCRPRLASFFKGILKRSSSLLTSPRYGTVEPVCWRYRSLSSGLHCVVGSVIVEGITSYPRGHC